MNTFSKKRFNKQRINKKRIAWYFIGAVVVLGLLVMYFWPAKEEDLYPEQPPEVREKQLKEKESKLNPINIRKREDEKIMATPEAQEEKRINDKITAQIKEKYKLSLPALNGEENIPIQRASPDQTIILKKSWNKLNLEAKKAGDPAICDSGKDYVTGFNDNLLIRCRAIASKDPTYCAFFDKQPNAKMNSIIFQQICMYEVFREHPRTHMFPANSCESMKPYRAFQALYLECRAIISHDARYCLQMMDEDKKGMIGFDAQTTVHCIVTVANYLQDEELCETARKYEAYYLREHLLNLPMEDELLICPAVF